MKGAVALYEPDEPIPAAATIHYSSYQINDKLVDKRFLWWLLRSPFFRDVLEQQVPQGIKTELKAKRLLPVVVPVPHLDEQRRIVARIEAVAKRVEEAERLQLDAIKKRTAHQLAYSRFLFNQLVERYGSRLLKNLFEFRQDLLRPKDGYKGQVRFVGLQHIEPNTGRKIGEDILSADELKGRKFRFSPSEIVYGYLRPYLNKVWIADCEGLCSVDQYVLRPDNAQVETPYLAQVMRSPLFLEQSEKLTGVLMLPRLRSGLLKQIQIPLPPRDEQLKVVELLNRFQTKSDELGILQEAPRTELAALLPAVLERAFRGEL